MHSLLALLQSAPDQEAIQRMIIGLMAVMPIIFAVGLAVILVPLWFICKKAGFTPWLCLLIIVPFGGLILLYVLAFAEWKVVPTLQAGWPAQPPAYPPTYPPSIPPHA